jgi:hypothetical protein
MKRPRQTESIRTVYSTDRQGQPTQKTSMSITRDITPRGVQWNVLKLPVYVILFWLLILGPIFAVQTTFENGKVVLADDFRYTLGSSDLNLYDFDHINLSFWSILGDLSSDGTSMRTDVLPIVNGSIIFDDYTKVTKINWFDGPNNDDMIAFSLIDSVTRDWRRLLYWQDFSSNIPSIYPGATHFSLDVTNLGDTLPNVSFSDFSNNEVNYSLFFPANDYYDIMENARTAEYLNIFGVFEFVLNLPNIFGESKPLAFIGVDNTTSEIWDIVTDITGIVGNITFDGIRRFNPIGWRP